MVAEHISDVVGRDHQGVPSLVDVLSKLAAYWVLCECGVEIGKAGLDGWEEKESRLGDEIDSLTNQISQTNEPSKKEAMQDELEKLKAQLDAIDQESEEANEETDVYRELFWTAREFCKSRIGIGGKELLNAALVGFDPERLQPGQGPSQHRMTELAMLLSNLKRHTWKSLPWANPTKPTMRAARRVAQNKRDSFIVRNLKHVGTVSGPSVKDDSLKAPKPYEESAPPVPENWLSPRSVADLMQETGCSRTTINDEVKNGNIPGGASRENNNSRGDVILQQAGLDYLKRKGRKDK